MTEATTTDTRLAILEAALNCFRMPMAAGRARTIGGIQLFYRDGPGDGPWRHTSRTN